MSEPRRQPQPRSAGYRYDELELIVQPQDLERLAKVERDRERPGCVFVWIAVSLVVIATISLIVLFVAAPRGPQESSESGLTTAPVPAALGAPSNTTSPLALRHLVPVSEVGSDAPYPAGPGVRPGGAPLIEGGISALISGQATWYCGSGSRCTRGYGPSDLVAAIDRKDTPFDKGDRVTVRHGRRSVTVRIVDVCACRGRRVIDLTTGAFRRLAPLSAGVIDVELEVGGPVVTLPPTSTEADYGG